MSFYARTHIETRHEIIRAAVTGMTYRIPSAKRGWPQSGWWLPTQELWGIFSRDIYFRPWLGGSPPRVGPTRVANWRELGRASFDAGRLRETQ